MADSSTDPNDKPKVIPVVGSLHSFLELGVHGTNLAIIGLVILGGVTIFNWFHPKKTADVQKQSSSITFAKGSTPASVTVINQQQSAQAKRTVGLTASVSSIDASFGFVKYLNDSWAVEIGPRYVFDGTAKQHVVPEVRVRYDFY